MSGDVVVQLAQQALMVVLLVSAPMLGLGLTVGLIIGIFLCVAYWAAMILGQTFGIRQGLSGFWTMWLPDFFVGGAGIVFYLVLVKK